MNKATFEVRLTGLRDEGDTYEFIIEDSFFQVFNYSDWSTGNVLAHVNVEKQIDGVTLDFQLNGTVKVICDRCLEYYEQAISFKQQLIVKFGDVAEEIDDNLVVVPRDKQKLDISGYLYEYLLLSLPLKKVHPDSDTGVYGCNREMLRKLEQHTVKDKTEKNDPRWDELKKLIDKK